MTTKQMTSPASRRGPSAKGNVTIRLLDPLASREKWAAAEREKRQRKVGQQVATKSHDEFSGSSFCSLRGSDPRAPVVSQLPSVATGKQAEIPKGSGGKTRHVVLVLVARMSRNHMTHFQWVPDRTLSCFSDRTCWVEKQKKVWSPEEGPLDHSKIAEQTRHVISVGSYKNPPGCLPILRRGLVFEKTKVGHPRIRATDQPEVRGRNVTWSCGHHYTPPSLSLSPFATPSVVPFFVEHAAP